MSYEVIIRDAKRIEGLLTLLGAQGKGLGEKAFNIEHKIGKDVLANIKKATGIRNRLIHQDGAEPTPKDVDDFKTLSIKIMNELYLLIDSPTEANQLKTQSNRPAVTNEKKETKPLVSLSDKELQARAQVTAEKRYAAEKVIEANKKVIDEYFKLVDQNYHELKCNELSDVKTEPTLKRVENSSALKPKQAKASLSEEELKQAESLKAEAEREKAKTAKAKAERAKTKAAKAEAELKQARDLEEKVEKTFKTLGKVASVVGTIGSIILHDVHKGKYY